MANALTKLAQQLREEQERLQEKHGAMSDQAMVHRVANAAALYNHAPEDEIDHSAHPVVRAEQARQPKQVNMDNLLETMHSEFQERFGYLPGEDTAKAVAGAFRGRDFMNADVRADFYDRVAAYDGKTERASVPSGNLARRTAQTQEERHEVGEQGSLAADMSRMQRQMGYR